MERKLKRAAAAAKLALDEEAEVEAEGEDMKSVEEIAANFVDDMIASVLATDQETPVQPVKLANVEEAAPTAADAAAAGRGGVRAAHNRATHSPSMGMSEECKWSMVVAQDLSAVDMFHTHHAPHLEENELSVDVCEDELLSAQVTGGIVPFEVAKAGALQHVASGLVVLSTPHLHIEPVCDSALEHESTCTGAEEQVGVLACMSRAAYNKAMYSPSMGMSETEHTRLKTSPRAPRLGPLPHSVTVPSLPSLSLSDKENQDTLKKSSKLSGTPLTELYLRLDLLELF